MDEELSVEMPEAAEPTDQESEENPEVAEPEETPEEGEEEETPDRDYEKDAAYADMRRQLEAAEREAAELKQKNELRERALGAQGYTGDDAEVQALAEAWGVTPEEVQEAIDEEAASKAKDKQIEALTRQLDDVRQKDIDRQIEVMQDKWLKEIQKDFPDVKELPDEDSEFWLLMSDPSRDPGKAYYMVKKGEERGHKTPPEDIGLVGSPEATNGFISEAAYERMTHEQRKAHHDEIMASMSKW